MPPTKKKARKSTDLYNIRLPEADRKRYEKLQQKAGYNTLSKMIRRAIDVVEANPSLLAEFPEIESPDKESYEHAFKLLAHLAEQEKGQEQHLASLQKHIDVIDEKLDWILKKMARTKQDKQAVKQLLNSTGSMEVIFNE